MYSFRVYQNKNQKLNYEHRTQVEIGAGIIHLSDILATSSRCCVIWLVDIQRY